MKPIHPLLSGLLLAALAGPTAAVADDLALFASGAGRGGPRGEDASKCDTASFSSAVVPATRSAFGSFFYNAFFEPSSEPLWTGHLEAYRLSAVGEILDSTGQPAVEAASGAFLDPRQPFWDAGTELLANTARKLYTTRSGRRADFNTSNVSAMDLGITVAHAPNYPNYPGSGVDTESELHTALIDYVSGRDSFDEDGDTNTAEMRDVVLGDIFHSTPAVVAQPSTLFSSEDGFLDFRNSYKGRDRVIYVGANDGMLHAVDAGIFKPGDDPSTAPAENGYYSAGTGAERFGYVPGLLLRQLKQLPINAGHATHYVDGSPVVADVWLGDRSGTDSDKSAAEWATVLITPFREGGPGYLALDVTDPDAGPSDPHGPYPVLEWEFTHSKLGDAWSHPVVTRVKIRSEAATGDRCGADDGEGDCREQWVAIFAGGYDPTGDPNQKTYIADPTDARWRDESKAIFMVALDSGSVLASVEFDASGTNGPAEMVYSIPSTPGVVDVDFDGFADVVYVGDAGGQLWKWDVSSVGQNTAGDSRIDNWTSGVFFRSAPVTVGAEFHHRSIFFPPSASFVSGKLTLAFGTGERSRLDYPGHPGEPGADENNRFYVVKDFFPTGPSAFGAVKTESDLADVTHPGVDSTRGGFYFVVADAEKFITDVTIFAGNVIVSSYASVGRGRCASTSAAGEGFLYIFEIANGQGFFAESTAPPSGARRMSLGRGLPSVPRVSIAPDGSDRVTLKTSSGRVVTIDPPERDEDPAELVYWRQLF